MKWTSSLLSGQRRNLQLAVVVVVSVTLIFTGGTLARHVGHTLVDIFHLPFHLIQDTVNGLIEVRSDNERLHLKLADVSTKLTELREAELENERLRAVLGFEPPAGYTLVPAKVVSVGGQPVPVSAVINVGTADSVSLDMPIINEQGLIGRIVSVTEDLATVQLLTDPLHRVAVRVQQSREMGIIKYRLNEGMILDNLPVQGEVGDGDLVLTSGLGGIYPPGLVVGTVAELHKPEKAPFWSIKILPAADFNTLEELFVLRPIQ